MESASALPGPEVEDVSFEISHEAAALVRDRGSRLWIWADFRRRPHATPGPPAYHDAVWTTFTPDGLAVHVDSAIVPPKRWVVTATPDGYVIAALAVRVWEKITGSADATFG